MIERKISFACKPLGKWSLLNQARNVRHHIVASEIHGIVIPRFEASFRRGIKCHIERMNYPKYQDTSLASCSLIWCREARHLLIPHFSLEKMESPFAPFSGGDFLPPATTSGGMADDSSPPCSRCGFGGCDLRVAGCGCLLHTVSTLFLSF
jgi:hypothetical protein